MPESKDTDVLQFDSRWRFSASSPLPDAAVDAYVAVMNRIAAQRDRKAVLERFKRALSDAGNLPYYPSSSDRFIDGDVLVAADAAAKNAPVFIDTVDTVISQLRSLDPGLGLPEDSDINRLLAENGVGYRIERPHLVLFGQDRDVPFAPPQLSLDEQARKLILDTLSEADRALAEGRILDAVQRALWLLETFSTAFRDPYLEGDPIEQKYFNKIIAKLRAKGTANGHQNQILDWMMALHGYLSAPAGGGIRHGIDLRSGRPLDPDEARLFCNLSRSYLVYLIAEYERMIRR